MTWLRLFAWRICQWRWRRAVVAQERWNWLQSWVKPKEPKK
jgi:hypothetical protein